MKGKGAFLWQPWRIRKGDPASIVALCRDLGLQHVEVKLADGAVSFGGRHYSPTQYHTLIDGFRNAGIAVWGWSYNYGDVPIAEGRLAASKAITYALDGWIFNGET